MTNRGQQWSVVIQIPELNTSRALLTGLHARIEGDHGEVLSELSAYHTTLFSPAIKELLGGLASRVGRKARRGSRQQLAIEIFAVIDMLVERRLEPLSGDFILVETAETSGGGPGARAVSRDTGLTIGDQGTAGAASDFS